MNNLSENTYRKYVESFSVSDWEIETDTGWHDLTAVHKTIEYQKYYIETESGHHLYAADTHILFDKNLDEIYLKDCIENETYIQTKFGAQKVTKVIPLDEYEHMFDVTVDSDDHRFYTNGIVSHNSTCTVSYILWCVLFGATQNIGILANKSSTAMEILKKLQTAYEHMPLWMQQGVVTWNKGYIELENGSRVIAASTASDGARGYSYNMIMLDEFAFVPHNIAEEFMTSVYPTISSGQSTKVVMVSTPNGMNLFYRYWMDAINNRSKYVPIEAHWSVVPGRDQTWYDETIVNIGEQQFAQEFGCDFQGSANTLISGPKLASMAWKDPLSVGNGAILYEQPLEGHKYVICSDVANGQGLDYSAFVVIDVTTIPYKQVCVYRSNTVDSMVYPSTLLNAAKKYNDAWVMIETNGIGSQIAKILYSELEYPQVFVTTVQGRAGQKLSFGFKKNFKIGLSMSESVKAIGCNNLKSLVENDQIILDDYNIIEELSNFVVKGKSFAAAEGKNDDLAMCLVLFGWLVVQKEYKEFSENDVRANINKQKYDDNSGKGKDEMLPFGYSGDRIEGFGDEHDNIFVEDGQVWEIVNNDNEDDDLPPGGFFL